MLSAGVELSAALRVGAGRADERAIWSAVGRCGTPGALPTGISLNSTTGVVSGTWPADRREAAAFVVAARDRLGHEGSKSSTIDTVGRPLEITTGALPDGTADFCIGVGEMNVVYRLTQEHQMGIFDGATWSSLSDPGFPDRIFQRSRLRQRGVLCPHGDRLGPRQGVPAADRPSASRSRTTAAAPSGTARAGPPCAPSRTAPGAGPLVSHSGVMVG